MSEAVTDIVVPSSGPDDVPDDETVMKFGMMAAGGAAALTLGAYLFSSALSVSTAARPPTLHTSLLETGRPLVLPTPYAQRHALPAACCNV